MSPFRIQRSQVQGVIEALHERVQNVGVRRQLARTRVRGGRRVAHEQVAAVVRG